MLPFDPPENICISRPYPFKFFKGKVESGGNQRGIFGRKGLRKREEGVKKNEPTIILVAKQFEKYQFKRFPTYVNGRKADK